MVMLVDPAEYMTWLTCPLSKAPRFFRQWYGPLDATPHPTERQKAEARKAAGDGAEQLPL